MRVFRTILGMLLLTVGLPALLAGAALWAAMQHRDQGGAFSADLQRLSAPGYAIVVDDVDRLLRTDVPFARVGDTQLRLAGSTAQGPVFVGLAPTAQVKQYLAGVPHSTVQTVDIGTGALPVATTVVNGAHPPTLAPARASFWTRSSTDGSLAWSPGAVRGGPYSLVVMHADASPGVQLNAVAELRPGWLNSSTWGLITLGTLLVMVGLIILAWPARRREVVYVVEPSQVPDLMEAIGAPLPINRPGGSGGRSAGAHRPQKVAGAPRKELVSAGAPFAGSSGGAEPGDSGDSAVPVSSVLASDLASDAVALDSAVAVSAAPVSGAPSAAEYAAVTAIPDAVPSTRRAGDHNPLPGEPLNLIGAEAATDAVPAPPAAESVFGRRFDRGVRRPAAAPNDIPEFQASAVGAWVAETAAARARETEAQAAARMAEAARHRADQTGNSASAAVPDAGVAEARPGRPGSASPEAAGPGVVPTADAAYAAGAADVRAEMQGAQRSVPEHLPPTAEAAYAAGAADARAARGEFGPAAEGVNAGAPNWPMSAAEREAAMEHHARMANQRVAVVTGPRATDWSATGLTRADSPRPSQGPGRPGLGLSGPAPAAPAPSAGPAPGAGLGRPSPTPSGPSGRPSPGPGVEPGRPSPTPSGPAGRPSPGPSGPAASGVSPAGRRPSPTGAPGAGGPADGQAPGRPVSLADSQSVARPNPVTPAAVPATPSPSPAGGQAGARPQMSPTIRPPAPVAPRPAAPGSTSVPASTGAGRAPRDAAAPAADSGVTSAKAKTEQASTLAGADAERRATPSADDKSGTKWAALDAESGRTPSAANAESSSPVNEKSGANWAALNAKSAKTPATDGPDDDDSRILSGTANLPTAITDRQPHAEPATTTGSRDTDPGGDKPSAASSTGGSTAPAPAPPRPAPPRPGPPNRPMVPSPARPSAPAQPSRPEPAPAGASAQSAPAGVGASASADGTSTGAHDGDPAHAADPTSAMKMGALVTGISPVAVRAAASSPATHDLATQAGTGGPPAQNAPVKNPPIPGTPLAGISVAPAMTADGRLAQRPMPTPSDDRGSSDERDSGDERNPSDHVSSDERESGDELGSSSEPGSSAPAASADDAASSADGPAGRRDDQAEHRRSAGDGRPVQRVASSATQEPDSDQRSVSPSAPEQAGSGRPAESGADESSGAGRLYAQAQGRVDGFAVGSTGRLAGLGPGRPAPAAWRKAAETVAARAAAAQSKAAGDPDAPSDNPDDAATTKTTKPARARAAAKSAKPKVESTVPEPGTKPATRSARSAAKPAAAKPAGRSTAPTKSTRAAKAETPAEPTGPAEPEASGGSLASYRAEAAELLASATPRRRRRGVADDTAETPAEGRTQPQTAGTPQAQADATTQAHAGGVTQAQAGGATQAQANGTPLAQAGAPTQAQTEGAKQAQVEATMRSQVDGMTEASDEGTSDSSRRRRSISPIPTDD